MVSKNVRCCVSLSLGFSQGFTGVPRDYILIYKMLGNSLGHYVFGCRRPYSGGA